MLQLGGSTARVDVRPWSERLPPRTSKVRPNIVDDLIYAKHQLEYISRSTAVTKRPCAQTTFIGKLIRNSGHYATFHYLFLRRLLQFQ